MGTKSPPRPDAQTPRVPSESFPNAQDTEWERTPCPNEFSAPLAEYDAGTAVDGVTVTIRESGAGDLVVADVDGKDIGRLTGLGSHKRRCLLTESYKAVVAKEDGDGPRVQLERIADH